MNIRPLVARAKQLYPASRSMRKAWVKQTKYLLETGSHVLQTGRFRTGRG